MTTLNLTGDVDKVLKEDLAGGILIEQLTTIKPARRTAQAGFWPYETRSFPVPFNTREFPKP